MTKKIVAEAVEPEIKMWFPVANTGEINFEARIMPEKIENGDSHHLIG